jgi:hypothetical protein
MQREENERNTGGLTVSVFTAGGALPLEGATVTVTDTEGNILRTATTDRSGRTPRFVLPSVRAEEALTPNPSVRPYSIYGIRITKDGYYTHENSGVPVFAGITSVQPAELIPFSLYGQDGERPDGNLFFSSAQTLDGEEN